VNDLDQSAEVFMISIHPVLALHSLINKL